MVAGDEDDFPPLLLHLEDVVNRFYAFVIQSIQRFIEDISEYTRFKETWVKNEKTD